MSNKLQLPIYGKQSYYFYSSINHQNKSFPLWFDFCFQQQATVLREDLAGFVFESNRGTKHSFTAETSLGPEFSTGWTGKRGKRLRSKVEQVKQKVGVHL